MSRIAGFALLALAAVLLSACAAGAPTVASDPTPTQPSLAAVEPTPAATFPAAPASPTPRPAASPSPLPSPTPAAVTPTTTAPATPTAAAEAISRPDPPPDQGTGLSQIYDRGTSGRMEVALTFDAGADRGDAEVILDTLAANGVKASFGITGEWAEQNPDLVARMAADGHMIFNHTYSHRSWTGYSTSAWDEGVLSTEERVQELEATEAAIRSATDGYETVPYFRPPYGDYDDGSLADLYDAGYYITVMWTCDSLGWNLAPEAEIIEKCGVQASPGDIILLHVGAESTDAEALPGLIEALRANGLAMVTVEELLRPTD